VFAQTQIQNTIIGVSQGFQKRLKLVGIGFRVQKQNNSLQFKLGFSHEITFQLPDGIDAICPKPDQIVLFGIRKDYLNQTAAKIRSLRKPDSYKGKGIQFEDEILILKEGKKK
jgi:large subunit ribosomal protein L6